MWCVHGVYVCVYVYVCLCMRMCVCVCAATLRVRLAHTHTAYLFVLFLQGNLMVVATAEREILLFDLRQPSQVFKQFHSPLKYQSRCVSCFPDQYVPCLPVCSVVTPHRLTLVCVCLAFACVRVCLFVGVGLLWGLLRVAWRCTT